MKRLVDLQCGGFELESDMSECLQCSGAAVVPTSIEQASIKDLMRNNAQSKETYKLKPCVLSKRIWSRQLVLEELGL